MIVFFKYREVVNVIKELNGATYRYRNRKIIIKNKKIFLFVCSFLFPLDMYINVNTKE